MVELGLNHTTATAAHTSEYSTPPQSKCQCTHPTVSLLNSILTICYSKEKVLITPKESLNYDSWTCVLQSTQPPPLIKCDQ